MSTAELGVALSFGALIILAIGAASVERVFGLPVVSSLGYVSYSLFLVHQPIVCYLRVPRTRAGYTGRSSAARSAVDGRACAGRRGGPGLLRGRREALHPVAQVGRASGRSVGGWPRAHPTCGVEKPPPSIASCVLPRSARLPCASTGRSQGLLRVQRECVRRRAGYIPSGISQHPCHQSERPIRRRRPRRPGGSRKVQARSPNEVARAGQGR